jgi:hypothetical protein
VVEESVCRFIEQMVKFSITAAVIIQNIKVVINGFWEDTDPVNNTEVLRGSILSSVSIMVSSIPNLNNIFSE